MPTLKELSQAIHETARAKGFWPANYTEDEVVDAFRADRADNVAIDEQYIRDLVVAVRNTAPRNDGEIIALIHSELSEALEAVRQGNPESEKIPGYSALEEELADAVIRILDFAYAKGYDLDAAIEAKIAYNKNRPHKHGKRF